MSPLCKRPTPRLRVTSTGVEPFEPHEPDERPTEAGAVDRWRRNTASGAVATALALGLQQVFEPARADTVGIEQEAPAKPADPERVELRFDPLDSRGTVVVVHSRHDD